MLDVEITGDVDLNKVTEVELKLAKMRMEEDFMKNQLKPGDPGFEYDKQVSALLQNALIYRTSLCRVACMEGLG